MSSAAEPRPRRPDRLGRSVPPSLRLAAALAAIALAPWLRTWPGALAFSLLGAFWAVQAGKRLQGLYFLGFVGSVTLFSLLVPQGRVLWRWEFLMITEGALTEGLRRGFSLVGMVLWSLAGISRELRLPGATGRLLAQTLAYFEALLARKGRFSRQGFWETLDAVLEEVWTEGHQSREAVPVRLTAWVWIGLTLHGLLLAGLWWADFSGVAGG